MDEQEREARIAATFRAATEDPPPPRFDTGDVVAASRRITRRRRSAVAGAALAVLAVGGIGVTAGLSGGSGTELTTAAGAPAAAQGEAAQGEAAQDAAAPAPVQAGAAGGAAAQDAGAPEAARAAAPAQAPPPAAPSEPARSAPAPAAGAGKSVGTPLGPGTRECADRQDPALRALVEQVLPEVVGAPEAVTTMECRPAGERGLTLEVRDGTTSGLLSVTYLAPGQAVEPPGIAEPPAAVVRSAPTASGGTVLVASRAERAGDPSPYASRLDGTVAYLAPRL
jgi:hypothetical protein